MLGQVAVAYGKVEAKKRVSAAFSPPAPPPPDRPRVSASPAASAPSPRQPAAPGEQLSGTRRTPRSPAGARTTREADEVVPVRRSSRPADVVPDAGDLGIPGYDSLAASQVVARLDGLTTAELELVRRYEQANRNRKTILGKIAQLEGTRH
jgi:hypothetical protein